MEDDGDIAYDGDMAYDCDMVVVDIAYDSNTVVRT